MHRQVNYSSVFKSDNHIVKIYLLGRNSREGQVYLTIYLLCFYLEYIFFKTKTFEKNM